MEEDINNPRNTFLQDVDLELLQIFIGKNYEKIMKQKFSVPAFLGGAFYMAYRKMFGFAVLYVIILSIAQVIFGMIHVVLGWIAVAVLWAVYGFFANRFYIKYAVKKINQLTIKRPPNTSIDYMCNKKGGTSVGLIFILLSLVFCIALVISLVKTLVIGAMLFNGYKSSVVQSTDDLISMEQTSFNIKFQAYEGIQKGNSVKSLLNMVLENNAEDTLRYVKIDVDISDIDTSAEYEIECMYDEDGYVDEIRIEKILEEDSNIDNKVNSNGSNTISNTLNITNSDSMNTTRVETDGNSEYKGELFYKTDMDINKILHLELPSGFEKFVTSGLGKNEYQWVTSSGGVCECLIGIVDGYSDAEELINQIAKYNKVEKYTNNKKSNGITWYYVKVEDLSETIYYHTAKNADNVYIFEYKVEKNVEDTDTAMKYYNDIFASIQFVE